MNSERQRKRQTIILLLAGALATGTIGCSRKPREELNNTFVTDLGYYHAPFGGYYPYPFNHYVSGMGYYGGGRWLPTPHRTSTISSVPRSTIVVLPTPNIPAPAPKYVYSSPGMSMKQSYSKPSTTPTGTKPMSSGIRSGGFGSSGHSAVS